MDVADDGQRTSSVDESPIRSCAFAAISAVQMQGMMIAIRVFSALFAIGVSVLFGWIIQKLRSPEIAAEFG